MLRLERWQEAEASYAKIDLAAVPREAHPGIIALSLAERHHEALTYLAPLVGGDEDEDDERPLVLARRALSRSRAALPRNEEEPAG
jgi:hypothetical protein